MRFTDDEVVAMKRLAERAQDKDFLGDLVLNAYNERGYKVSIAQVMRYLQNEPEGSTLTSDVDVLFSLMMRGVEVHELTGQEVIHELIDIKKYREEQDAKFA